jgi:Mrp family chromosome partitioning ATPase
VQLYVGTTREFVNDAVQHQLGEKLSQSSYDYYGHVKVSELQSWQNSLTAMALQISHAQLFDHGIVVEMELPLSSARLDCMIFGRDRTGRASALLVELKQWSQVKPSDVEGCVVTFVGGAERDQLHPSMQALTYAQYLADAHEGYDPETGVAIRPSSFLHNMLPNDARYLRSPQFDELMTQAPLFVGRDADRFAEAMRLAVGKGDGELVMRDALSKPAKPSRQLLQHTAAMIAGEPRYTLLDEQRLAFRAVMGEVRRAGRAKTDHAVIVVKGGPGTGKSVIALNLVGTLSKLGFNVRHATGSKAFTQTLWSVLGRRIKPQFRYFNQFGVAEEGGIDVLICDEAHRIRQTSNTWRTARSKRTDRSQVEELISSAKTSVFFIDEFQSVRPEEVGSANLIRDNAIAANARYREVELRSQFRCAGSATYLEWVDQLLEVRKTGQFSLPPDEPFEFEIVDSPGVLDAWIRTKQAEGYAARLTAGYCWKWSPPDAAGGLLEDIVIDGFRRPWNAQPDATKLAPGIPPAPLWAWTPSGVDQVGCIYTAQGFEFDYVGVIFGTDLVVRDGTWIGQPSASHDSGIKQKSNTRFLECVKNIYRVLLTRGLKGCYVTFLDDETRRYVEERIA